MRKLQIILFVVAVLAALALSGCSTSDIPASVPAAEVGSGGLGTYVYETSVNGTRCIVSDGHNSGGIDCDFAGDTIR